MALAMLDKYAADTDFQEILRGHGAGGYSADRPGRLWSRDACLPRGKSKRTLTESLALAALFASGDNGQSTIRTIKNDGLERVAELDRPASVTTSSCPCTTSFTWATCCEQGYAPTTGETTWALVDGCFVITDVLSLVALPARRGRRRRSSPQRGRRPRCVKARRRSLAISSPAAANRPARLWSATRPHPHSRQGASQGGSAAAQRLARWWSVRSAGGMYQVLKRLPEALPRLSLTQLAEMAGPLAAKAGLRLSSWRGVRLMKNGALVVLRIPPERGLKYVAAQAVQAGVGVVGIHKMEEYLKSRRPPAK